MNYNELRNNAYTKNSGIKTGKNETEIYAVKQAMLNEGLIKVPAATDIKTGKDSVYRRVAKFLLLIGIEEASKVLPLLNQEQTEKIIPEIMTIQSVNDKEAAEILEEFQGLLKKVTETGGKETARTILEKAYGSEKAEQFLKKAVPFQGSKPFDYLNDSDNEKIFQLLNDESTAVKSLVLTYIEPKKAASVINMMETETKKEVVMRLAKMETVNPEILKTVDEMLHKKADDFKSEKTEHLDGRTALAEILKKMSPDAEQGLLSTLADDDPELSHDLKKRLFTFDDVINADNKFIQNKLREMENLEIIKLIAGKPVAFRNKILSCISSGRRNELIYDEETNPPIKKSEAEKISEEFITSLRTAYENGELIIKGRNDDIFIN